MMRLSTLGCRSGEARAAIIGYYEDGPNLLTLAMNGWGRAEPAWWLNLQDVMIQLVGAGAPRRRLQGRAGAAAEVRRWVGELLSPIDRYRSSSCA